LVNRTSPSSLLLSSVADLRAGLAAALFDFPDFPTVLATRFDFLAMTSDASAATRLWA